MRCSKHILVCYTIYIMQIPYNWGFNFKTFYIMLIVNAISLLCLTIIDYAYDFKMDMVNFGLVYILLLSLAGCIFYKLVFQSHKYTS